MYRVIGGDLKEYGPATAEEVEHWIRDGRLSAQCLARLEESSEWKPLGTFPEFTYELRQQAEQRACGAGLSPEDLGRLFGRFQRLSAKPTAGESSTGLGFSIVKRIIDMHGGEVIAEEYLPVPRICEEVRQMSVAETPSEE